MTDVTAGGQCLQVQTGDLARVRDGLGDVTDALAAASSAVGTACDQARHSCGDRRLAAALDEYGQLARSAVESLSATSDAVATALQRAAMVYDLVDIG